MDVMVLPLIDQPTESAIALNFVTEDKWKSVLEAASERMRSWISSSGFEAKPGRFTLVPEENGKIENAWAIMTDAPTMWDFASIAARLPARTFRVELGAASNAAPDPSTLTLGWALSHYQFARYRTESSEPGATLVWPEHIDKARIQRAAQAIRLIRDLINTPAEDMAPKDLAETAVAIAKAHAATCTVISGDDLLAHNYPTIHRVGRASAEPPCLIDLKWGDASHPKVTLVGKGVCFDSGGLDIKSDSNMRLMKKDMGGAAHVLGIAQMVMDAKLPVRLRALIPAVENAVSGNAMRPLDVIKTRKGTTVEVGHTDAEGRLILADALTEADSENPACIIDIATLTGAARVALGTELPALFCNHDAFANDILEAGQSVHDPLWRLPLWQPYKKMIKSDVADLSNDSESRYGGAITAALFLETFVSKTTPWAHIDAMAWNVSSSPGRPVGGEAMSARAIYAMIEKRFATR